MRPYFEVCARGSTLIASFIAAAILIFVIYPAMPIGGEALDVKMGYSYAQAMAALEEYGQEGRGIYIWVSATADTLILICWAAFFAGLVYRYRLTEGTWFIAFAPVFVGVVDLLENLQVITMLVQYPEIGHSQVAWASAATLVKHWGGRLILLYTLILILVSLFRPIWSKSRSESAEKES